jgi:hypothetical protein
MIARVPHLVAVEPSDEQPTTDQPKADQPPKD